MRVVLCLRTRDKRLPSPLCQAAPRISSRRNLSVVLACRSSTPPCKVAPRPTACRRAGAGLGVTARTRAAGLLCLLACVKAKTIGKQRGQGCVGGTGAAAALGTPALRLLSLSYSGRRRESCMLASSCSSSMLSAMLRATDSYTW